MSKTWTHSNGDIRQVLRTLFNSSEFWARSAYRAKVKTPEEFVLSAVRATGGEVENPAALLNAMNQLGMPFYGCQTPNGYPWTATAWVNTGDLLSRINLALALAGNKLGTATDLDTLLKIKGPNDATTEQKEGSLEALFLNGQLTANSRQTVLREVNTLAGAALPAPPADRPIRKSPGTIPLRAAFVQVIGFTHAPYLRPPISKHRSWPAYSWARQTSEAVNSRASALLYFCGQFRRFVCLQMDAVQNHRGNVGCPEPVVDVDHGNVWWSRVNMPSNAAGHQRPRRNQHSWAPR